MVGSGGREHTLLWKLAQSPKVSKLYCAPGNAGIQSIATGVNIAAEDIQGLLNFVKKVAIDLTIVGPEAPLVAGIVDEFTKHGYRIFGPSKNAAQIEGSKVFSKDLMKKYNIPTAAYEVFEDFTKAEQFVKDLLPPIVVKAEGLAAGKGVIICQSQNEALVALKSIMKDKAFGDAGNRVVIEEFLKGPEVTILSFCDGEKAYPMVSSRDYKRVFDNQKGPNTGGMGAISPTYDYTPELTKMVEEDIIQKTVDAMAREGYPFKGILYTGLILTDKGPKVLEYNCRFGDPETQVVIPRLETDLVEIVEAAIAGDLSEVDIKWKEEVATCIVLASGGYPGDYEIEKPITGIKEAEDAGALVFHAGTKIKNDKVVTNGGRVLGVVALGKKVKDAREKAYEAISKISFEGMHYRKDIGM